MAERSDPLKRHFPALFLAAACAGFPWRLCAANLNPPLSPLVASAWMGFEYPLLKIFLSLAIAAILLVALLKRRHRPELLAVCLALSIVLHLLSLSLFSLMSLQRAKLDAVPKTVVSRITFGIPTLRESQVSQSVRAEPLKIERMDTQNRLSTDRVARSEPVKDVISKAQAALRETAARAAGHGEFKTPDVTPPKKKVDEPLEVVPNRPIEVSTVKIAIPQKDQRAPEAKQTEPGAREKRFDVGAVAQASMPQQEAKPSAPQAGLKDPSQLPAPAKINLIAVESRQPEVKDVIQPAVAKSTVDRLELRANEVADARGSGRDERVALAKPSADVKLDKRAGDTPRTTEQRMTVAVKPTGQPRMSVDSLAAESPDRIERKKNEVGELSPEATADATRLEPVRMSDVQPLMAFPRSGVPGQVAVLAQSGQREWMASKEQRPIAQKASLPVQEAKPSAPQAGLKDPSQLPAPAKINLIAVESRQPEVKDVIQPAVAKSTVDRLELRANEVADARGSGSDEHVSLAKPSADVKLGKLAGSTPRITENRVTAAKSAGQPRMAADSLAAESPDRIERKKNEVGGLSPEATAAATLLEPVRMGYVQPLIAATRPGTPGQVPSSAPTGQRELTTAREKIAVSGVRQLTDGKPRAGVKDAVPSKEPIRIGLGGEAFAEPMSKAPAVHDVISDVSAERPGLPSLGDPALKMELMQDDQRARGPAADKLGPSDLAAVKINGGLGSAHVAAVRVAPKRVARSQNVGVTSGTLIEESGVPLQTRESTSAAVKEQLAGAQAGGGNPIGHGLADMGAPVQAVAGVMRGGSSGEGSDIRSVALAPARAKHASAPSEAGGIERPSPTRLGEALGRSRAGRSDLPVSQDSFVGQGPSVAAPRVASSAVSEGEQVETAASLTLRGGDAKVLAGRMSVESQQGEDSRLTDGGEGEGGRGQAELSLGKAGGEAAASGISVKRFQTPGRAGGGLSAAPAGTLVVQSDLQAVGRATASGTAEKESLVALNTSASASDSSGPALVAPTVIRRDSSAGGTAEAGGLPVGVGDLQVAKAGGADPFLFEPQGGGGLGELAETMNGVSEPDPSLMDLILSAGPSKARVTSDISASPSGQVARRSFLSVGTTPNPEFVPEKAIYKMRKPEKRRQFIKELGGTVQTEEAVEQALAWLSRAQSDDGRWDIDGFKTLKECGGAGDLVNEDVGVTGLVLLAYLGAGYTHLDGAYQETVRKGLDWLLNCEKKDGDIRGAGQMYGQAMATTALCESYALTGDERLLAPTQRAVKFIVDSQTPESGWRYMSRNDSDTSVTGWQILALKSAQIAGFTVPDQTFRWMNLWLDKVRQGADGGLYSYKPGHVVTPVMTAEGAFCQLFMGEQANARAQAESVAFIMQNLPVWNPESRSVHIYYWYYATLTIYLSGAQEFKAWNSALTKALLQGRSTSGPAAGSWDPVCLLGFRGGRIYSTAVGALCLEVYYRFLPLYKQKKP